MAEKYSAKLTGNPFLFFEMKIVASLKEQGLSDSQIKEKVINENLFQYKTRKSLVKRVNEVLRRINVLNEDLLDMLVSSDIETAKLICLYSILKTDRLFFEFMEEVVVEKYKLKQNIENIDIKRFFEAKSEQDEDIAHWSESTKARLLPSSYKNILKDSGLIKNTRKMEVQSVFIAQDLSACIIKNGDRKYLKVMLGE